MRLLVPAVATVLLAACGTTPTPVAVQLPPPEQLKRGGLIGMSASELVARFGTPRLQVREGEGSKLQFAAPGCLLDAYLYPPADGSGLARVSHVDTRNREGRSFDQAACIALVEAR